MAKGVYIGVKGVARKIKKGHVGVEGVARKIKKAYIGVGGVARPFWSGGEIAYYGTLTSLQQSSSSNKRREIMGSGTVGNYAIFAGGAVSATTSTGGTDFIDVYNKSLTKVSTSIELSSGTKHLSGAETADYVVFAGGNQKTVDAVNASLTLKTCTALSQVAEYNAGTSIGGYALFAGGSGTLSNQKTVYAYNNSLTQSKPTELSQQRRWLEAASIGDYAIFAGGNSSGTNYVSTVDAYNQSLTKVSSIENMSKSKALSAAASNSNYAIFMGGWYSSTKDVPDTDAYNKSLTHSTFTTYSAYNQAGISHPECALFCGGENNDYNSTKRYVMSIDNSLTKKRLVDLSTGMSGHSGELIGEYGIFAGGDSTRVIAYMMPQ